MLKFHAAVTLVVSSSDFCLNFFNYYKSPAISILEKVNRLSNQQIHKMNSKSQSHNNFKNSSTFKSQDMQFLLQKHKVDVNGRK